MMDSHTSLTPTEWLLCLCITALVVEWQLSASASITSKIAGILTLGGLTLGVSIHAFEWFREQYADLS